MKFKRTLLAVCTLGLSTLSFNAFSASMPEPVQPQPTAKHWVFGGEFGYSEGGSDDNGFAANTASPVTRFHTGEIDGASFGAFFGYENGHGGDVMASWLVLDDSSGTKHVLATGSGANPIVSTRGLTPFGANTTANGRQKTEFNWLQFTFGHTFNNTNHSQVHIRGGFDIVDFSHNLWTNTFQDNANNHWADFKSNFEGGGLVAGVDYLQECWGGFQLFSKATVGLNYGDLDSRVKSQLTQLGVQPLVERKTQTKMSVIPLVAAEMGVGYGQNFWNVQAGVRGLAQFDVVQHSQTIAGANNTNLVRSHYMQADVFGRITFRAEV